MVVNIWFYFYLDWFNLIKTDIIFLAENKGFHTTKNGE